MFVCLFLIHRRKRVKSKYFFKNMSIIFLLKKVVQVVWISIIVQILYSNEKKINFPICISAPSWKGANRLFFKTVHGFIKSILITVTLFFFSIYFGSEKKEKKPFYLIYTHNLCSQSHLRISFLTAQTRSPQCNWIVLEIKWFCTTHLEQRCMTQTNIQDVQARSHPVNQL